MDISIVHDLFKGVLEGSRKWFGLKVHSAQPINLGKPEMHDTFSGFKLGKISFSQSPHESFDEEICSI